MAAGQQPIFAGADWGTSSFRLWLLGPGGAVLGARHGAQGMATLKPAEFGGVLGQALSGLGADAALPVVVCGMAGAAQGWHPVPYLDVPARLDDVAAGAVRVPGIGRDVRILPGLAQRTPGAEDVIRGEETILMGAVAAQGLDGLACLPGTHSKWVTLEAGRVTGFATAMTGELYALISRHSTLAHYLDAGAEGLGDHPAFREALREALARPAALLRALFSIRARPLLGGAAAAMPARLSGLLIGAEIAGMRLAPGARVTLVSGGALGETYRRAFEIAGIAHGFLEAGEMARAGLFAAGQRIWGGA